VPRGCGWGGAQLALRLRQKRSPPSRPPRPAASVAIFAGRPAAAPASLPRLNTSSSCEGARGRFVSEDTSPRPPGSSAKPPVGVKTLVWPSCQRRRSRGVGSPTSAFTCRRSRCSWSKPLRSLQARGRCAGAMGPVTWRQRLRRRREVFLVVVTAGRVSFAGMAALLRLDILGGTLTASPAVVGRLRDLAAARAGQSSSQRDLSLVLDRALRTGATVALQRREARALLELVEALAPLQRLASPLEARAPARACAAAGRAFDQSLRQRSSSCGDAQGRTSGGMPAHAGHGIHQRGPGPLRRGAFEDDTCRADEVEPAASIRCRLPRPPLAAGTRSLRRQQLRSRHDRGSRIGASHPGREASRHGSRLCRWRL
jgi:hypothetical protein